MNNNERILKATGRNLRTVLERVFKGQYLPQTILEQLSEGQLDAGIGELTQIVQNPYNVPAKDLAPRLVGAPILLAGTPTAGIITHAAPYVKSKADWEKNCTPRMEPGSVSVWHANSYGGYDVALIWARSPSTETMECVAIWETRIGSDLVAMKDTVKQLKMRDFEGKNLNDLETTLLLRPYASTSLQRGKYTVTQQPETKKGAGCTESYKLTSA